MEAIRDKLKKAIQSKQDGFGVYLPFEDVEKILQSLQSSEWVKVEDRLPTHDDLLQSKQNPKYKEPNVLCMNRNTNDFVLTHYVNVGKEYYSHWKIIDLTPPSR